MEVKTTSSPFGSRARTLVLLALRLLVESYPRELERLLGIPLSGVQRALGSLESDGLVAARAVGRTRMYRLDPRYFAHEDLQRFLLRLSEPEEELRSRIEALRRRPRRSGKPL
ncbi:MAG: winged helix-turn-helix transcriptional regulator [Candidatus Latescibacterota bacterium]|nr:MAG: winged helix-turn-helix transcriptional regulator [Candidatus Latescibacterota bacterium]